MRNKITESWKNARDRAANFDGYGNLPVLAELHVPWAPYARARDEHSISEDGLQVPINDELSPQTAQWHENGKHITGTIVNRASLFDLHRIHVKRLRVTSHLNQVYKGLGEVWKQLQEDIMPGGKYRPLAANDPKVVKLKQKIRHQQTMMLGMEKILDDGMLLEVQLHLMTTVMLRDGVLHNTDCPEGLARQIRFDDTMGYKLMLNPETVGSYYGEGVSSIPIDKRAVTKRMRELRNQIVNELGEEFSGLSTPGEPLRVLSSRRATDAFVMPCTGVTVPAASPHSGGKLTRSRAMEQKILEAITFAVADRFSRELTRIERMEAAKAAQNYKGVMKKIKTAFPQATPVQEALQEMTAIRERKKRHDQRSRCLSPVSSPAILFADLDSSEEEFEVLPHKKQKSKDAGEEGVAPATEFADFETEADSVMAAWTQRMEHMTPAARALVAARFPLLAADTIADEPTTASSTRSSVKRTHSVAADVASHSSSKRPSTTRSRAGGSKSASRRVDDPASGDDAARAPDETAGLPGKNDPPPPLE